MTRFLLVLPILVPLVTAALCLLAWSRPALQRLLSFSGSLILFAVTAGILRRVADADYMTVAIGGWPPPFGIVLVADRLSALMLLVSGSIALLISIYQWGGTGKDSVEGSAPIFQILFMGVCGAFLAGDLFNLYVWFEVMLIASFVLMAWGGGGIRLVGSLKYVVLNLISSALFLAAVGLVYARFGTLNMADLAQLQLVQDEHFVRGRLLALLFLASFGIKAGIFPFFFWLPDSYPTLPAAIGGLFAALLTKVGIYALLRIFTLVFHAEMDSLRPFLLSISALTMTLGVFGALAQEEIRRILSFHIISQIGYMIFGLALFTPMGIGGTIFFMVSHIVSKTNLFLIGGLVRDLRGSTELDRLGGLIHRHALLGACFLASSLSLSGIPPLAGFWAKLGLIVAGLESRQYGVVAIAIFVSLLTLVSMMKIWTRVFWGESRESGFESRGGPETSAGALRAGRFIPVCVLALLAVALGVFLQPVIDYTLEAANQLLNPAGYVEGVLNASR